MNTTKQTLLFLATIFISDIGACPTISQPIALASFHTIKVEGRVEVRISSGNVNSLSLDKELAEYKNCSYKVENNELVIKNESKGSSFWSLLSFFFQPKKEVESTPIVSIQAKKLKELAVRGCSIINFENFKEDELSITASGKTTINGAIEVKHLEVTASGKTDVCLSGYARSQEITLSGKSSYDAHACKSKNVEINASGATSIDVNATKSLAGSISGCCELSYCGNPKKVDIEKSKFLCKVIYKNR